MVGIYKIESPSKRIYVGQSIDIVKRKLQYERGYGVKGQKFLYRSLLKYGWDNHNFEVIEECSIEELNNRERYWQDYYNCVESGLNCKLTTSLSKSGEWHETIKDKISGSMSKYYSDPANREHKNASQTRKLYQYSLSGEFIKEWTGLRATARKLNIQKTVLNRSVLNSFGKYKGGGFYWSYDKTG